MKKSIFLTYFLFLTNTFLFSQKNTLSLVYTPAITKLNTNYLAKNMALQTFQYWYTARKPDKPMYGFNAGFTYKRRVNSKISFETGLFYTELKQHTGNFYGDKKFNQPPVNYLASELVFKYTGIELPLNLSYSITHSEKWNTYLGIGVSINSMGYFEVQDFVTAVKVGQKIGCCTNTTSEPVGFSNLKDKLDKGYFYRLGISIGYEFAYNIHPHWELSCAPLFKYYSNALKDKDTFGALDADAYFLGLQSKINFKF